MEMHHEKPQPTFQLLFFKVIFDSQNTWSFYCNRHRMAVKNS
jgi:hypothetical protein